MSSGRFETLSDSVDDLDASYQRWIYKQLEKRVQEYSHVDKVSIMCATWNVNAKFPSASDDLKQWLLPENTAAPDIYAIGLQEIVDLNVMNIVLKNSATVETSAIWVHKFSKILNTIDYYKVLLDKSMVGICFVIFVKASLHSCIRDVKYSLTYTGSYGVTGNKGGITISMRIHDSPVCFVCAHFHANRDAVQYRNLDYELIVNNKDFVSVGPTCEYDAETLFLFPNSSDIALMEGEKTSNSGTPTGNTTGTIYPDRMSNRIINDNNKEIIAVETAAALVNTMNPVYVNSSHVSKRLNTMNAVATVNNNSVTLNTSNINNNNTTTTTTNNNNNTIKKNTMKVLDHEYIFWMGDLNYRLNEEIELVEIFERLYNDTWDILRSSDQLLQEKAKQNIFHGFNEGLLSFPPTYKYQPGTDLYEQRIDKKLRAPAWCDRILYRSTRIDRDITMLHYRVASLHMSDHKPISAMFIVNTRKIIKDKLKSVYSDLLFTVDKWINESKPKIEASNRLINFGPIQHNQLYRAVISLKNTGSVMAEFSFVPKNDETEISKSWLKFSPMSGVLAPEESVDVEVLVILNLEEAYEIATMNNNVVDDIVILRITNGNDFFCIVNATLTADTCAAVCTSYARLGNRNSDFLHSAESSPLKIPVRQTDLQTNTGKLIITHKRPV